MSAAMTDSDADADADVVHVIKLRNEVRRKLNAETLEFVRTRSPLALSLIEAGKLVIDAMSDDIDTLLQVIERLMAPCGPPEGWSCGAAECEDGFHMIPEVGSWSCYRWPHERQRLLDEAVPGQLRSTIIAIDAIGGRSECDCLLKIGDTVGQVHLERHSGLRTAEPI